MNKLIICFISVLLFIINDGFIFAENEKGKTDCNNKVSFGNVNFYLPDIDGMVECSSIDNIKSVFEDAIGEGNTLLGLYLDSCYLNTIKEKLSYNIFKKSPEETVKIYIYKKSKNFKYDKKYYSKFIESINNNFIKNNWNDMKNKMYSFNGLISYNKPVIIDSYNINENINTFIMLKKINLGNYKNLFLINAWNIIFLKNKIISISIDQRFRGEKSYNEIKLKNNNIVSDFYKINKKQENKHLSIISKILFALIFTNIFGVLYDYIFGLKSMAHRKTYLNSTLLIIINLFFRNIFFIFIRPVFSKIFIIESFEIIAFITSMFFIIHYYDIYNNRIMLFLFSLVLWALIYSFISITSDFFYWDKPDEELTNKEHKYIHGRASFNDKITLFFSNFFLSFITPYVISLGFLTSILVAIATNL